MTTFRLQTPDGFLLAQISVTAHIDARDPMRGRIIESLLLTDKRYDPELCLALFQAICARYVSKRLAEWPP